MFGNIIVILTSNRIYKELSRTIYHIEAENFVQEAKSEF